MRIQTKVTRLLSDLETPITLYLKIRDLYVSSALLESSDYNSRENSYSFIGIEPVASYKLQNGRAEILRGQDSVVEEIYDYAKTNSLGIPFLDSFQAFLDSFKMEGEQPENNGLFGYTSHEAIRYFNLSGDSISPDDNQPQIPELYYIFYRFVIVINHLTNELSIIENQVEDTPSRTDQLINQLVNQDIINYPFSSVGYETSALTDQEHAQMVSEGIALCKSSELDQIVLSRSFYQNFQGDEFNVYRALRSINPSPYLFYFDFGAFRIFGSSPETHCRITNGRAVIDPIAGTYRRTGDEKQDNELAKRLLSDPKELEEHDMLVEYAQDDLKKNCSDVKVEFYKNVQFYSHVIHLVSRVSGAVNSEVSGLKIFTDTFPAGTLVGSPKVNALDYISKLETQQRGFYGGCIGSIGFNGNINQAITIRTFLSYNNTLYYRAGGGITAQSNVDDEVNEVKNKLGALKKAILSANELIK